MTPNAACHILSAGFSFHRKPFHMSRSEGVQYYLLRLQTEGRSRTMDWRSHHYCRERQSDAVRTDRSLLLEYRQGGLPGRQTAD
jgi:hypothetical protein